MSKLILNSEVDLKDKKQTAKKTRINQKALKTLEKEGPKDIIIMTNDKTTEGAKVLNKINISDKNIEAFFILIRDGII